jgi:hypothetical protein
MPLAARRFSYCDEFDLYLGIIMTWTYAAGRLPIPRELYYAAGSPGNQLPRRYALSRN